MLVTFRGERHGHPLVSGEWHRRVWKTEDRGAIRVALPVPVGTWTGSSGIVDDSHGPDAAPN